MAEETEEHATEIFLEIVGQERIGDGASTTQAKED